MSFQTFLWRVALLCAVVGVGVVGFRYIEGWTWLECIWMAVITVTTIGFGEIHPLSDNGRWFTLLYIVGAVGAGGYAVAALTGYVVDGGLARDVANSQRRRQMQSLHDHFLVVGYGRLGREVTEDLLHQGARVVVIDSSEATIAELPKGAIRMVGDGSHDAVLLEAGIAKARGIAIATPSSAINVFITLSARHLNAKLYIITRVDEDSAEPKARRAGADAIVSPYATAGSRIAHRLLHRHAAEFLEQMLDRQFPELALDDVTLPAGTAAKGTLGDLAVRDRYGVGVIAIRRIGGTLVTVPDKDAQIGPGDVVVVVGPEANIKRFREAAGANGG